ncbi:hypothetical protein ACFPIJ_14050 [Dactylosporangium cerinum]|uniref:Uncharacterized protein n=1 Tax=Dactylosporangium cerinum TaxID=1434730 RepID=A0ABV9VSB3_9ACTN
MGRHAIGRVALPLKARVEGSPEMVAVLRGKPDGDTIAVTVGNMADEPVKGPYSLVHLELAAAADSRNHVSVYRRPE